MKGLRRDCQGTAQSAKTVLLKARIFKSSELIEVNEMALVEKLR